MRYILQIFLVLIDKLQKKLSFLLSTKITHLMNEKTHNFYVPLFDRIFSENKDKLYTSYLNENQFATTLQVHDEASQQLNILNNDDITYIDCGANYGYFGISVLKKLKNVKNCILIEPSKFCMKILKRNTLFLKETHRITYINEIAGADEMVNFKEVFSFLNTGKSGVNIPTSGVYHNQKSFTLDKLLEGEIKNFKKVFLKIDAEGHELIIIQNAPILLNITSFLLIEISKKNEIETCISILKSYNFNKFIQLNDDGPVIDLFAAKV